jgi:HEAT repeats
MPDDTIEFETLDLRFRATPHKQAGWLPGGVILWFILGIAVGGSVWVYGRRELAKQLEKQAASNSPTESILALDALHELDPNRIDHLVLALRHADIRVAKSSSQLINLYIDKWNSMELTQRYSSMRSFTEQLGKTPHGLPEANVTLVRSIAARFYSITVATDDPQIKPVAEICKRLLVLESVDPSQPPTTSSLQGANSTGKTSPPQSPPGPLSSSGTSPRATQANESTVILPVATFTQSVKAPDELANPQASVQLISGPTRPRATVRNTTSGPGASSSANQRDTASLSLSDSERSDSPKSELPVVVATPASIASTPLASMKVVSNSPDLAGIEKMQIAELVKLLGHNNSDVGKAAALALRHHGLSDEEIQLATELANGSANRRLQLIQQIAAQGNVNPRPWLVWMAEDGEPEVRRMAVSLLAPMIDETVTRSLRNLAVRESDSQIKEMITRVLATTR